MTDMWPGEIVARIAKEEGATHLFGILGGHIEWLIDNAYMQGLDVVQVRHEQAAVFAADAFARINRRPGICFATAGPGMLNMATGVHLSYLCGTPLVCFLGGSRESEAYRGSMQEAYAEKVLGSITKWTYRITDPRTTAHFVRKAFKDAMTPPYGPVALEFPVDLFNFEPTSLSKQVSYVDKPWGSVMQSLPVADQNSVERAAKLIVEAKRPMIIGGDGLYWSRSSDALQRLVAHTPIPFNLRRMARGLLPENHELGVVSPARPNIMKDADLILLVGVNVGYLEGFGAWRTDARFIQINDTLDGIFPALPTELAMVGDCGAILDQITAQLPQSSDRADWLTAVGEGKAKYAAKVEQEIQEANQAVPLKPRLISDAVTKVARDDAIYVADSFTLSAFFLEQLQALAPGQVLDTGASATFGNGVGMAIGAQMAAPDRQVIVLIGDGGMGLGGGDIEVAVRYELPIVFVVYNNSMLGSGLEDYAYGEGFPVLGPKANRGFHLTQDVRYDEMYAALGCHGEHVTEPAELEPALKRALESGKTAVVNIISSANVRHRLLDSDNAREMFWHLPADQVQPDAKARHHDYLYRKFHNGKSLVTDD
jgi:acetolactate synthase-1/2/3 large subunit